MGLIRQYLALHAKRLSKELAQRMPLCQRMYVRHGARKTELECRAMVYRFRQRKRTLLGLRERMEALNGSAAMEPTSIFPEAKRSAAAPADPEVVDRPLPGERFRLRRTSCGSSKKRTDAPSPSEVGQLLRTSRICDAERAVYSCAPDDVAQGGA